MPLWRPRKRRKKGSGLVTADLDLEGTGGLGLTGAVVSQPQPGSTFLRVGFFGFQGHIGEGPDGTTTNPYRVAQWNPRSDGLTNVPAILALAQQKDILIVAMVAGGGDNFRTNGAFDLVKYEARLDEIAAIPEFNQAVAAGRVHIYFGDEPNNTASWGDSWTPTLWNAAARACKDRWPTGLTYGRLAPTRLRDGWANQSGLPTYDAIDYGWLQYSIVHRRNGLTFQQALDQEKAAAAAVNVGVALSLNLVAGGIKSNFDGVTACWDHDLNGGTEAGIILGSSTPAPYVDGEFIACSAITGTNPPNAVQVMANPDWIRRSAAVYKNDLVAPFLLYWTHPGPGAASPADVLRPFWPNEIPRSDVRAALTDAMASGLLRTQFNGYRSPKP